MIVLGAFIPFVAALLTMPPQLVQWEGAGQTHQPPTRQAITIALADASQAVFADRAKGNKEANNHTLDATAGAWRRGDYIQFAAAAFTALYFFATVWILIEM